MVKARFMTPSGKFRTIKEESFATTDAALEAAKAHYSPLGFSNFAIVDDYDQDMGAGSDTLRITAKTKGGRSGRNIVFLDLYDQSLDESYERARSEDMGEYE